MHGSDPFIYHAQAEIQDFCNKRNWDQFHTPKDLAIGLVTEASELLELFRFANDKQTEVQMTEPLFREKVQDELADVLYYLLRFSQMYNFDLPSAFSAKMKKNSAKYPVELSKGRNVKYTELKK